MADLRPVPADLFEDLLDTVREPAVPSAARTRLRTSVALSSTFAADDLSDRLGSGVTDGEVNRFLAEDCAPILGSRTGQWRLRTAVRHETLAGLTAEQLRELEP
ncbi:MAG TPA: hypothetical protein VFP34_01905, partial [Microlunatus sp.]|nr:hypothetical protein [Microlunatus sp.]